MYQFGMSGENILQMLDLITYPRFFSGVAAEQHILRFILVNLFYDYSVDLQILIVLTMVKTACNPVSYSAGIFGFCFYRFSTNRVPQCPEGQSGKISFH